jgi:dihydroflavonol-4-reductase
MDCTLNLIDVRDVAVGLSRVMERGKPGRRYLLGHSNLTLVAFLELLSELTDVPIPQWRVPYSIGIAAAWFSEFFADHFTGRAPKATLTGVRLAKRIMHFDVSRSLIELGLQPRSIRESLVEAVEWLRLTGRIPICPTRRRQ